MATAQQIIKRAAEVLAPASGGARSAIGQMKDGSGQSLYDGLCSLLDQDLPTPKKQQTELEAVVRRLGLSDSITIGFNGEDKGEPPFQITANSELLAGPITVGDETLSGAVKQLEDQFAAADKKVQDEEDTPETEPKEDGKKRVVRRKGK